MKTTLFITTILVALSFTTMAAKPKGTIYYSKCEEGILLHLEIDRGDASQRGGIIIDKNEKYEFIEYRKTAEQNQAADFFATSDQISFQWSTLPAATNFTVYILLKGVAADLPIKKIKKIRGVFYYVNEKGKEKEVKLSENKKITKPNPAVVETITIGTESIDTVKVEEVENNVESEPVIVPEAKSIKHIDTLPPTKEPKNRSSEKPKKQEKKQNNSQKNKATKKTSKVHFKVQVTAKMNNDRLDNCKNYFYAQYNINHIEEEIEDDNGKTVYKYVGISLPTYRQAQLERDIYVSKGVLDAFIVGYLDGKRVDIQTAINAQK